MAAIRNLNSVFGSTKTRTFFIFVIILLVIAVGIAMTNLHQTVNPPAPSRVTRAPGSIQNIPGGQTTEAYRDLQVSRNQTLVEQAVKSGTSAIPTITGTFQPLPKAGRDTASASGRTTQLRTGFQNQGGAGQGTDAQTAQTAQLQALAGQLGVGGGLYDEAGNPLSPKDIQQLRKNKVTSLSNQAKKLIKQWSQTPQQQFTQGKYKTLADYAKAEAKANGDANGSGVSGLLKGLSNKTAPVLKTGEIAYAVLTTEVNSVDTNAPVLANIVGGKLRGARIVGRVRRTKDKTRMILQFYSMSLPNQPASVSIDAVAVNPENGRAGLATSVNKHYFKRYGALFASSFLSGYSRAISQQGTTVTNRGDDTTETSRPKLSGREEFFVALGDVGNTWGSQVKQLFRDTEPTVKVKSGVALGVMFLSDVTIQQ